MGGNVRKGKRKEGRTRRKYRINNKQNNLKLRKGNKEKTGTENKKKTFKIKER